MTTRSPFLFAPRLWSQSLQVYKTDTQDEQRDLPFKQHFWFLKWGRLFSSINLLIMDLLAYGEDNFSHASIAVSQCCIAPSRLSTDDKTITASALSLLFLSTPLLRMVSIVFFPCRTAWTRSYHSRKSSSSPPSEWAILLPACHRKIYISCLFPAFLVHPMAGCYNVKLWKRKGNK